MRKVQKISQVFPIVNGLFGHMNYTFRTELSKSNLDVMFVTNYGKRNIAPVVEYVQGENYGEQLTNEQLTQLASIVLEMYKEKWDKLGRIYDIDYDPIHNYLDEWNDRLNEEGSVEGSIEGNKEVEYGKVVEDVGNRRDSLHQESNNISEGTTTRTDELVRTEQRDLANSNTQTNDLSESLSRTTESDRTDNLLETVDYGKKDIRTDALTNSSENTFNGNDVKNDNNQVYAFNSVIPSDTDSYNGTNQNTEHRLNEEKSEGSQSYETSGSDTTKNSGNQNLSESVESSKTNTGTRTDMGTESGSITTSDEGTVSTTDEKTSTGEVDSVGLRETGNTSTSSGSDSITNSETSNELHKNERDRVGRHFGNIGNLTSQKQLLEEINLWKWNYMKEILDDVKEFCTLPIYLNATEWQLVDQQY